MGSLLEYGGEGSDAVGSDEAGLSMEQTLVSRKYFEVHLKSYERILAWVCK